MRKILLLFVGAALIACETGCRSVAPPRLIDPSTASPTLAETMKKKQDRAVYYDPYPDEQAAPHTDSRPRDYNTAPAEVKRAWGADVFQTYRGPGRSF